jgi:hypothetical protein
MVLFWHALPVQHPPVVGNWMVTCHAHCTAYTLLKPQPETLMLCLVLPCVSVLQMGAAPTNDVSGVVAARSMHGVDVCSIIMQTCFHYVAEFTAAVAAFPRARRLGVTHPDRLKAGASYIQV